MKMEMKIIFCWCLFTFVGIKGSPLQTVQEYTKKLCLSELDEWKVFEGSDNDTQLRYLKNAKDDALLYIGGKGYLYKVNKDTLTETDIWQGGAYFAEVADPQILQCKDYRPNPEYVCQNYINVVEDLDDNSLLVCGSNSYYPACWLCNTTQGSVSCTAGKHSEVMEGLVAPEPDHHPAWLYLQDESFVFGGTDLLGSEATFSKYELDLQNPETFVRQVETDTSNPSWINKPAFVGSPIRYKGKIYFFYRETAVEYINAGKIIYSRVAQVCVNDTGGKNGLLSGKWVSFLKARLNCSIQGDFPFYFDEIQDIFQSPDNETIIYAVFTTPVDGPAASAVCIYNMENIVQIFERSHFKGQQTVNSIWLPLNHDGTKGDRPGTCDQFYHPSSQFDFLREYALVDTPIPNRAEPAEEVMELNSLSPAIVVLDKRFVTIVAVPEGNTHDVFMIGTDKGTVLKAYYNRTTNSGALVAEIEVAKNESGIQQMTFYKSGGRNYFFVSTRSYVHKIPFKFCEVYKECSDCVSARDIHCQWNTDTRTCDSSAEGEAFPLENDCEMCPTCPNSNEITIVQHLRSETCSEQDKNVITMDFLAVSSRNVHLHCEVKGLNNTNLQKQCEPGVTNNVDYFNCRIFSVGACSITDDVEISIKCTGDGNTEPVISTANITLDSSVTKDDPKDLNRFWQYHSDLMKYLYDLREFKNATLANCRDSGKNIHSCPAPVFNSKVEETCPPFD